MSNSNLSSITLKNVVESKKETELEIKQLFLKFKENCNLKIVGFGFERDFPFDGDVDVFINVDFPGSNPDDKTINDLVVLRKALEFNVEEAIKSFQVKTSLEVVNVDFNPYPSPSVELQLKLPYYPVGNKGGGRKSILFKLFNLFG